MDMDTQGNATSNLSLTEIPAATLTDVIVSKTATLADTVCHTSTENLDLIRGGSLLAPALATMQEMPFGRDTTLRRLLPQIPDTYDFVFFDCSPSLESLFNINVLVAVQYVLIPIKVDKNSIEGYDVMLETIQSVREIANPDIRALGIFMTAVETVIREGRPHGKLCIGFTPDEEIGEGADLFDIPGFGADFAYTVDGGDAGDIEYENFNAAAATVTIHGFSVHPGSAKDTMINASNVAMEFHGALPVMARPETTEGRQGFYHLCQMYGDVTTAKLGYILRDHDAAKLQFKKDNMLDIAEFLNGKYGEGTVTVEIKDSYRNMLEKIKPHFHLVETARKATRMAGLEPEEIPVRGGTDGAMLSWKGLPCPNLGTGGFNFHGVCECITAERMDRCTEILLNIIKLYAE